MKTFNLTPKQGMCYIKLTDNKTTQIGYGGAGGGGKSIIGCLWIITQCLKYSGVHYYIARKELTTLKKTTLLSFFEVVDLLGYKNDEIFKFNGQTNIVNFHNGSKVFLVDLAHQPSDPLYTRFGGLLLTSGFIDESNESDTKGIDILNTRIGRWKNKEYNLLPKTLEAFNPAKNHVYSRFYKLWRDCKLPKHRTFIQALPTDNPHLSPMYIDQLRNSDKVTRERLLYGNFEYDDDPAILVEYDAILDLFTNEHVGLGYEKYISTDLAMQGRDLFVISSWEGLRCRLDVVKEKSSGKEIIDDIKMVSQKRAVPRSHVVADSDGMGGFLEHFTDKHGVTHEGFLKHIKTFHNGAKARNTKEYTNLKSECAFKLAELINKRAIYIKCDNEEIRMRIIEELDQLRRANIDKDDMKKSIIKKDVMKEALGRSPDFLDVLIMRMIFELKRGYNPVIG